VLRVEAHASPGRELAARAARLDALLVARIFVERWWDVDAPLDVWSCPERERFEVTCCGVVVYEAAAFTDVLRWCLSGDAPGRPTEADRAAAAVDVSEPDEPFLVERTPAR
jgi:hypothetical protein